VRVILRKGSAKGDQPSSSILVESKVMTAGVITRQSL
jgi:hypothetical protein